MGGSKIQIYSGNTLKIPCDCLFLYEVTKYSRPYKRLQGIKKNIINSRNTSSEGANIEIYRTDKYPFKKLIIIDCIETKEKNVFKQMSDLGTQLRGEVPKDCTLVFNIADNQDPEGYKAFIDKMMNEKKVVSVLSGASKDIRFMLGYFNQSGHMLSNVSTSYSDAIKLCYEKLACSTCKKLDVNSKVSEEMKVYCSICSSIRQALNDNSYIKRVISQMKDPCLCKKDIYLSNKHQHRMICPVSVLSCNYCNYQGGQADVMNHLITKHPRVLIDNIPMITSNQAAGQMKTQCIECGFYYEGQSLCSRRCPRQKSNNT